MMLRAMANGAQQRRSKCGHSANGSELGTMRVGACVPELLAAPQRLQFRRWNRPDFV
uniref:Uncharacterized protein n=1 Tax=Physcomitrium patens TaxID=3218 RepID=A0A2K1IUN6_PHYPA|nr:hypothetical protein PHYPA_024930 [Physcomitrium patens]